MSHRKIVILGAGLAGLSAAWHLQEKGISCQLYEKEPEVGGLCRSKQKNGFTFDYDGHLLHFRHKEMFGLVKELLGDNLVEHKRYAWVYSFGRFTPYPFQANLHGLPMDVMKECLSGFVAASNNGEVGKDENFLRWIKGTFGEGIAKYFMVPYNTKFWTVPLGQMTCEWLDGFIPRPTMAQVIEGTLEEGRRQLGYNAHFWYPREGGIGRLPQAFKERLRQVHTGHEVRKIDIKSKEVVFSNGVIRNFDHLISTIPLPELARVIRDVPAGIKAEFKKLRWNSVYNLNLGFRQERPSDKHWAYFPQKNISFFRVGFYHNFARDLNPSGTGSMYAEVAYGAHAPIDKKRIAGRIEQDLRKVGFLSREDKVVLRDINDIKYAYPVYDKNYASARSRIIEWLAARDIALCGRYGAWKYMSMEDVLLDGQVLAQKFI
ncbi:MAG: FAD-dependent oxidoreductase [Candidatus Omnitrophota bacterium]